MADGDESIRQYATGRSEEPAFDIIHAMLADPVITNADAAEKCLDELLSVHAAYLPRRLVS